MKLFSLLLGAALVSGASAAACDTCRSTKTATCTSKTVDLTCTARAALATTGAGNFLDKTVAATPECKACANANTKTCTSATVATACDTGAWFIKTTGAAKTCTACHADCATCAAHTAVAATKCITCVAGKFGGAAAPAGAACADCAAAVTSATVETLKALTCFSATKAKTCPPSTVLGGTVGSEVCIKCKANTATCTATSTTTTQASTVSVKCLSGFGGAAGVCSGCQPAGTTANSLRALPVSCVSATKALTCPVGSVLGGPAGTASCVKCSANTLTCTKGAELLTQVSTISTKCNKGFFIKTGVGTARTCVTCTAGACATATMPKKFANAQKACPLGTETADLGLAATNCGTCQGGATCTGAVALKAPAAALTCAAKFTKRVGTSDATKCLAGAFGDNVSECVADCANMDGKANAKACGCGKAKYCAAGEGCTVDKTKIATVAGACAKVQAPAAKKAPASTLQASALLSAAALLVAMRQ